MGATNDVIMPADGVQRVDAVPVVVTNLPA